jgi:hypothetical protein
MFLNISTSLSKTAQKYQYAHEHVTGSDSPVHDLTPRCFVAGVMDNETDSPLSGRVPIGSLILAVNNQNVVEMSKEEIYSLIDSKQAEERVLTFKLHCLG